MLQGYRPVDGDVAEVQLPPNVIDAMEELGLSRAVGRLRLLQVHYFIRKPPPDCAQWPIERHRD